MIPDSWIQNKPISRYIKMNSYLFFTLQAQAYRVRGSLPKSIRLHIRHLRTSKRLKEQLPAHLLPRSELSETILVFVAAQRSGVLAPWHIYYLHNSDADSIYFLFVPSNVPHECPGTCFPLLDDTGLFNVTFFFRSAF